MAEASISVAQDQFMCPVCLDLLKDPVTIPCGHSFCKVCINGCWDQEDQKGVYSCPQCRDTFTTRPVLRRNNMLDEVVEKLKKTEVQAASPAHCYAGPGDVECDFCTGRKHKAVKSCLMCLTSFCEIHLKPHLERPALKKHTLIEASAKLQEKICSEHGEVLKIYCRTDQTCVCYLCTLEKHKDHDAVSVATERAEKQVLASGQLFPSFTQTHVSIFLSTAAAVQIISEPEPQSREEFLKYFCYLTLDPNTAHRLLILSEKNRALRVSEREQRYSDHPERFDYCRQVLCKERVCGRCYWEVEWSGAAGDVSISVSYKDISRKGEGNECGFGYNSQSWSLWCSSSSLSFYHNSIKTDLGVPSPSRIGVYVDHSAGTLSFYSVSVVFSACSKTRSCCKSSCVSFSEDTELMLKGCVCFSDVVLLCKTETPNNNLIVFTYYRIISGVLILKCDFTAYTSWTERKDKMGKEHK
ncbi:tripartite motif-containing protein 16-like [Neoarius graeffei]|uniref:tripartite motif-containing protein 16-like n=1 Tax=Neoarius graeffei TaxID=443677 RepID=UPI00298BFAA1|nr:tripartite motif-containing protein 16-like [Neoarius graeffei]